MKKIIPFVGIALLVTLITLNLPRNNTGITMEEQKRGTAVPTTPDKVEQTTSNQLITSGYADYSQSQFDQTSNKKRVFFFHARWCPTCKAADQEFKQNTAKIPANVMLFKTDYDAQAKLKAKYGITYQHTFVYVDSQGSEIKKWNGGGITELISNTTQE